MKEKEREKERFGKGTRQADLAFEACVVRVALALTLSPKSVRTSAVWFPSEKNTVGLSGKSGLQVCGSQAKL